MSAWKFVAGVILGWFIHREREAWRWVMGEYSRKGS